MKNKDSLIRKNGVVYTPEILSKYVSKKLLQYAFGDELFNNLDKICILDPSVGDGILLNNITESVFSKKTLTKNKLTVCGIDIDKTSLRSCKKKITPKLHDEIRLELINTNALNPFNKDSLTNGWNEIFRKLGVENGFDLLIANPPWGADITDYKENLKLSDFKTIKGQFDSFELFIELAIKIVKPNGYFAFIVPDSILNNGKSVLRETLLDQTQIRLIARLGEKIFPGINRACVVIICKNTLYQNGNFVDCFRLSSKNRTSILSGQLSFLEAESANLHQVPQKRFKNNTHQCFDIDIQENETVVLDKFKTYGKTLGDELSITRGMELGSSGMICQCKSCKTWIPLPEKKLMICSTCDKEFDSEKANKKCIISPIYSPKSISFISGSDMKRYVCKPSKWTTLGVNGINYKQKEVYEGAKILIRKTGVGITASLDYSNSYTNQVVYILKNKDIQKDNLEFFIGLINTRAYFFYLMKTFGELQWKSHPYLTQTQIRNLPLPDISSKQNKKTILQIKNLLRPTLKARDVPNSEIDAKVELLIGKMFSLTENDYKIIFNTISELDDLLPMREMKKMKLTDVFEK